MRHLRLYRAIKLIADQRSIRKAAETLAISPSALNRSIQAFETELGIQIFDRVANGVRLSVAGELLIRPISEHLAQIDDFTGLLAEMRGATSGALRVSVSEDLWPGIAVNVTDRFRDGHPAVGLDIHLDNGLDALRARRADLALVTVPVAEDDVEVVLTGRVPVVGHVSAEQGAAGDAVRLSDLQEYRLLVPPIGTGTRLSVDLMLRRSGIETAGLMSLPGPALRLRTVPHPDIVLSLAQPDDGIPAGLSSVGLGALRLQEVQVTLLARAKGYLPRASERFAVILGAALDGLAR